jgi:hypothetical protein
MSTVEICANCGDVGEMEAAHVIPRSLGGIGTVPLCPTCHGIQHSMRERQDIRELTRIGLARRKAAGERLGRPVSAEAQPARLRLRELLHERLTFNAIATILNDEGYTTPRGRAWTWRHVQKTRDSLTLDDDAAALRGHDIIHRPVEPPAKRRR